MVFKRFLSLLALIFFMYLFFGCAPAEKSDPRVSTTYDWPDTLDWWKRNNLRVMQVNLPAYEAGLNADSLVNDLIAFQQTHLLSMLEE